MPRKFKDSVVRRAALNMKTTPELRDRLEKAARASGRALTHEVEHRIEQSFLDDRLRRLEEEIYGSDEEASQLANTLRFVIGSVSRHASQNFTAGNWKESFATRTALRVAIEALLHRLFELHPVEEPARDSHEYAEARKLQVQAILLSQLAILSQTDPATFDAVATDLMAGGAEFKKAIKASDK